ncbi:MAG: sulfite exporter TauE/SafE family protein [Actinomycetota bacterium]|nr:sulfite exporter TauE/SafE family protein [Actinomycetota bacterium]
MTVVEVLAVLAAGTVAGGVNAVVGSGSLITFPTLLAVGFSPVTANVSNCVGLVPGGVSGSFGYRRELRGQWRRCGILAIGTTLGAVLGGILLLELPDAVFDAVVPALILLAVALMAFKPSPGRHAGEPNMTGGMASSFATGIYGGYFGAAQGIILVSLLRLSFPYDLQVLNAMKNVLAGVANAVAGLLFIVVADVAWDAALLIAAGSLVGAAVGARYGRRIPSEILRRVVIVYGTIVALVLIIT